MQITRTSKTATQAGHPYTLYVYADETGKVMRRSPTLYVAYSNERGSFHKTAAPARAAGGYVEIRDGATVQQLARKVALDVALGNAETTPPKKESLMARRTSAQIVAAASDEQLAPSEAALDEAAAMLDEFDNPTQEQVNSIVSDVTAGVPIADVEANARAIPATKETPVAPDPKPAKPLTAAQKKAEAKRQGVLATADAAARAAKGEDPTDSPIAVSFRAGKTIAQIARQVGCSQKNVREHLDIAGLDYSGDKNNGQASPAAAAPASRSTRTAATPIDKLDAFIGKFREGDLSAPQRSIADTVKDQVEVGHRIAAIGALQQDDPEAFGRALVGLANFLWSVRK